MGWHKGGGKDKSGGGITKSQKAVLDHLDYTKEDNKITSSANLEIDGVAHADEVKASAGTLYTGAVSLKASGAGSGSMGNNATKQWMQPIGSALHLDWPTRPMFDYREEEVRTLDHSNAGSEVVSNCVFTNLIDADYSLFQYQFELLEDVEDFHYGVQFIRDGYEGNKTQDTTEIYNQNFGDLKAGKHTVDLQPCVDLKMPETIGISGTYYYMFYSTSESRPLRMLGRKIKGKTPDVWIPRNCLDLQHAEPNRLFKWRESKLKTVALVEDINDSSILPVCIFNGSIRQFGKAQSYTFDEAGIIDTDSTFMVSVTGQALAERSKTLEDFERYWNCSYFVDYENKIISVFGGSQGADQQVIQIFAYRSTSPSPSWDGTYKSEKLATEKFVNNSQSDSTKKIDYSDNSVEFYLGTSDGLPTLVSSTGRVNIAEPIGRDYDNGWGDTFGSGQFQTKDKFEFVCEITSDYFLRGIRFNSTEAGAVLMISAKHAESERKIDIDMEPYVTKVGKNTVTFNSRSLIIGESDIVFTATFDRNISQEGILCRNRIFPEKYGNEFFIPAFENIMEDLVKTPIPSIDMIKELDSRINSLKDRVTALESKV